MQELNEVVPCLRPAHSGCWKSGSSSQFPTRCQLIDSVKLGKDTSVPILQRGPWRRKEVQQLVPMPLDSYMAELGLEPSYVTPGSILLFLSTCIHCFPPLHTGCTWFLGEVPMLPLAPPAGEPQGLLEQDAGKALSCSCRSALIKAN